MGKSSVAIIAFVLSWLILDYLWKGKETNFNRVATVALILVVVGLILTFPPVWSILLGAE
jgi:high-affinity Fe2+/Pb2+ permease